MGERIWEEPSDDDRELADEAILQPGTAAEVPGTALDTDVGDTRPQDEGDIGAGGQVTGESGED
jgi:hypothetical protein